MSEITAAGVAQEMLHIFSEFGWPSTLVMDGGASTSFVFVALLNKQQIVDCDRTNNYGRPELFVSDFSACAARFGR